VLAILTHNPISERNGFEQLPDDLVLSPLRLGVKVGEDLCLITVCERLYISIEALKRPFSSARALARESDIGTPAGWRPS